MTKKFKIIIEVEQTKNGELRPIQRFKLNDCTDEDFMHAAQKVHKELSQALSFILDNFFE